MLMSVEFKANSYTLLSLDVGVVDAKELLDGLREKLKHTPTFFSGGSLVLNVVEFMSVSRLWELLDGLEHIGINVIAISGMVDKQISKDLCLPILQQFKAAKRVNVGSGMDKQIMYIDGSVLSGSSIDGKEKDVVVFGGVSHGGEVRTSGSVTVVGHIEGRVYAGVGGNTDAVVCGGSCNAQLISISSKRLLGCNMDKSITPVKFCIEYGVVEQKVL